VRTETEAEAREMYDVASPSSAAAADVEGLDTGVVVGISVGGVAILISVAGAGYMWRFGLAASGEIAP